MWKKILKINSPSNQNTLDKLSDNGTNLLFNGTLVQSPSPTNKTTLDKIGENGGQLTFNGAFIAAGTNPSNVDFQTENLFDKTRVVIGSYHSAADGTIKTGGGVYGETHAITIKPGYNYTFYKGDGISMQYAIFDSSGTFITGASNSRVITPTGAATLYVNIPNVSVVDKLVIRESTYVDLTYIPYTQKLITSQPVQGWFTSKWYGKTWWVFGDSISTGNGDGVGSGNVYANKPYHYLLSQQRFIHVQNRAVSGYTVGNVWNNIVANIPVDAPSPDLITFMIGTNDHGFNTVLGTINDAPAYPGTFYAVYKLFIENMITKYPTASIGLITPIQRNNISGSINGNNKNAAGFTLRDYCDAVVTLGKNYGIPVLDWYYNLSFTPYNTTMLNTFYCGSPSDGTHPNDIGHIKMTGKVGDFIEQL